VSLEVKRVVRIGGSFYVALPKAWVLENKLESGYVVVEPESGGALRIRALRGGEAQGPRTARLVCSGNALRKILSAYLKGYEVLEVEAKPGCAEELHRAIAKAQSLLVGLEVIEETPDRVVLQCFTRSDYSVESLLYRMNSVSVSMLEKAAAALEAGDEALAREVRSLDDRVDRLYFLAVRVIRSRVADPLTPPEERVRLVDLRLVARNIEDISDTYESLALLAPANRFTLTLQGELAELQKAVLKEVLERRGRADEVRSSLEELRARFAELWPPVAIEEKIRRVLDILGDTLDLV
jgi:phosphate uptake regulator